MITGLPSLSRKLRRSIPDAVRLETAQAMEKQAEKIKEEMRRRSPKRFRNLEKSINWTWGSVPAGSVTIGRVGGRQYGRLLITIYAGDASTMVPARSGSTKMLQNARLQEFGTGQMPPTPYFFTTWRQRRRGAKSQFTRAIKRGVLRGAR